MALRAGFFRALIPVALMLPFLSGCGADCPPAGDFFAMVIADTHISNDVAKTERFEGFLRSVEGGAYPGVELVLIVGDVVSSVHDRYHPEAPDAGYNRLAVVAGILERLTLPVHLVMGNHDYKIERDRDSDTYFGLPELQFMEQIWTRHTGYPPYYSAMRHGWKFIVLNSMRGRYLNRHFDDEQLQWLESELSDDRPVILAFHHPLETDNFRIWCKPGHLVTRKKEPRLYSLLQAHKQKIKAIFVGHGHRFVSDRLFGTIGVHEVASFGDRQDSPFLMVGLSLEGERVEVSRGTGAGAGAVTPTFSSRSNRFAGLNAARQDLHACIL
jgi:predicted phosphodiesterase